MRAAHAHGTPIGSRHTSPPPPPLLAACICTRWRFCRRGSAGARQPGERDLGETDCCGGVGRLRRASRCCHTVDLARRVAGSLLPSPPWRLLSPRQEAPRPRAARRLISAPALPSAPCPIISSQASSCMALLISCGSVVSEFKSGSRAVGAEGLLAPCPPSRGRGAPCPCDGLEERSCARGHTLGAFDSYS